MSNTTETVTIPADEVQALARVVGVLEEQGVRGLSVVVSPGRAELVAPHASYGVRVWETP